MCMQISVRKCWVFLLIILFFILYPSMSTLTGQNKPSLAEISAVSVLGFAHATLQNISYSAFLELNI